MNKLLINFIKETSALSRCFLILVPKKCQIGADVCIDRWAADSLDTGQVADNNFCRPGDKWNWRQTTKAADWSRRFVSGSLRGHETRRPYIKSTSWKVLVTFIFLWITIKVDWFNFKWIGVRQRLDWLFNGPTNVLRMWVNRRPSCRSSERKVFGGVGRFHRPGFPPLTLTSTSEGFRPIRQFLSFHGLWWKSHRGRNVKRHVTLDQRWTRASIVHSKLNNNSIQLNTWIFRD